MKIVGIDFSSSPTGRKPITLAVAHLDLQADAVLHVVAHRRLSSLTAFEQWLAVPDAWVAGFDFPFGLPRPFLRVQGWGVPEDPGAPEPAWSDITALLAALSRQELVARCRAWAAARPVGDKFAHRATDQPAGSSPSMKWVNPPVALMLHAGAPRLLEAGVTVAGLRAGDPDRIALEAYPAMLARLATGRTSYKSDDRRKDGPARRDARTVILTMLESGSHPLTIAVRFADGLRESCLTDPSGDTLDAVLCAVQAAWGWIRRGENYGLPPDVDPLEGWIVSAAQCHGAAARGP